MFSKPSFYKNKLKNTNTSFFLQLEQLNKNMKKFKIDDNMCPQIKVNDPLGSFYGIKVGQMIETKYHSDTNGVTISYRICIT